MSEQHTEELAGLDEPLCPYPLSHSEAEYRAAFRAGALPVAVYGLGKMGLPLAAAFAEVCGSVVGVDIDDEVVARVAAGDCPIEIEPGLDDLVAELVAAGELTATTEPETAALEASIHVVIVPTLLEGNEPDVSALTNVCEQIAAGLTPGDLVLVESTVPPGTCSDQLVPLLAQVSGLSHEQFGVAFCPERTASGRALQDIRGAYPKIVGGTDEESGRAATALYREINSSGVHHVDDSTTAEAVKLFEGVYRDVNIALANELAMHADDMGIDVRAAIETANTQPYCDIHDPGPGVGGHCIPFYPYFLFDQFDRPAPLLRTAREINEEMPTFTAQQILDALSVPVDRSTVAIFGVTYRPGVPETRAAPAVALARLLSERGARVLGVDPLIDDWSDLPLQQVSIDAIQSYSLDGLCLVTPHEEFEELDWSQFDTELVVDGRDTIDSETVDAETLQVRTLGVTTDCGDQQNH